MNFRVLAAVFLVGCATPGQRRADEIELSQRFLKVAGEDDPGAAEARYLLAYRQIEEAQESRRSNPGRAAQFWSDALVNLNLLIERHPDSPRLAEALFLKAECLSQLDRWSDAVLAWRAVPRPRIDLNREFATRRLAQSLRRTHRCEEAVELLQKEVEPELVEERCRCLEQLGQPCEGKP